MIYDHSIAAPNAAIRNHVLVRKRGRSTRFTRLNLSHFWHVQNAFNLERRRRCGRCGNLRNDARTCCQAAQAQAVPAALPALGQSEDAAHFDPRLDAVNAASKIRL